METTIETKINSPSYHDQKEGTGGGAREDRRISKLCEEIYKIFLPMGVEVPSKIVGKFVADLLNEDETSCMKSSSYKSNQLFYANIHILESVQSDGGYQALRLASWRSSLQSINLRTNNYYDKKNSPVRKVSGELRDDIQASVMFLKELSKNKDQTGLIIHDICNWLEGL